MSRPSPALTAKKFWLASFLTLTLLPAAAQVAQPRFEGRLVHLIADPGADAARVEALGRELESAVGEMAPRVPVVVNAPLRVAWEPTYLEQIRATDQVGEAVVGSKQEFDLHLVAHPRDKHAYRFALAQALLRRAGLSAPVWIERGGALWLSRQWYGRDFPQWLPLLVAVRALPSAADLLASEPADDSSALLWTPAAAAVVDARPGKTLAAKLSGAWDNAPVEAELSRLAGLVQESPPVAASKLPPPRAQLHRGVSLAMNPRAEVAYPSPSVAVALDRLVALGADSVAIMPFAYQKSPTLPGLRFLNRRPSSETEIGCLHAARRARERGFTVMWKPHLWIGHQSWPGEVEMLREEDWRDWWVAYRRYILHHAFLARWAEADFFVVGVELDKTIDRPEWPGLIADVRRLFPGALTYASNWYGGLEKIPFWDRLDYVGVDAYFPLASSPTASDGDLAAGARAVAERLESLARISKKPLLLTEVGFAAHRAAWTAPHEEGGEFSQVDQARSYRALLKALEGRGWLAGLWLWKAFSQDESGLGPSPDFRFIGRAAEAEIRRWFLSRGAPLPASAVK